MSNAVFYRSALARELSADARRLFETQLLRSEQIGGLQICLFNQILANRQRREGSPVRLGKSAERTIKAHEREARKAAEDIPHLVATIPTEDLLVQTALGSERMTLKLDRAAHTGGHPEDEATARPMLELRERIIGDLEEFSSKRP